MPTILVNEVFGFEEHQQIARCGLGYKLLLKKNNTAVVVVHALDHSNESFIFIRDVIYYIPYFTSMIAQQSILGEHVSSRAPTQLSYLGTSVLVKDADAKNIEVINFELKMVGM